MSETPNPAHMIANEQGELFPAWSHHAVFTDSTLSMLDAEADHRRHAIIEQVIADLKAGPLAHLPSGQFAANSTRLVLAAIAFNLIRPAGCLASTFHAKARTATIRINSAIPMLNAISIGIATERRASPG